MKPAVFLDRDGVINENRSDYVRSWNEIVFLDGVFSALQRLAAHRITVIVVTNQSAVGRGLLTAEEAYAINRCVTDAVAKHGGDISEVYLCPHHPAANCDCRKPAPGMILEAAAKWNIDLSSSYLIGDAVSDIEAARAAGVQGILVLTGRGTGQAELLAEQSWTCPIVTDLSEAVDYILQAEDFTCRLK